MKKEKLFNDGNCFYARKDDYIKKCITCNEELDTRIHGSDPIGENPCIHPMNIQEVKGQLKLKLLSLPEKINKYAHHVYSVLMKGKEPASKDLILYRVMICEANEGVCFTGTKCEICSCPVNRGNPLTHRNLAGWVDEKCPLEYW